MRIRSSTFACRCREESSPCETGDRSNAPESVDGSMPLLPPLQPATSVNVTANAIERFIVIGLLYGFRAGCVPAGVATVARMDDGGARDPSDAVSRASSE